MPAFSRHAFDFSLFVRLFAYLLRYESLKWLARNGVNGMAKPEDDLEAVRTIAAALGGFSPDEQERIIRWAREKIGLAPAVRNLSDVRTPQVTLPNIPTRPAEFAQAAPHVSGKDLKTFVATKRPKSDVQFAATVAYFYRFEAPADQRKNEIDAATLQDACRLSGRARFNKPLGTLNNAKNLGVLDSGSEKGRFTVNTVGENLVAMTLPDQGEGSVKVKKPKKATNSKKRTKKTK
jgi:hypothetical protein